MPNRTDLTDQKFGRLTVLKRLTDGLSPGGHPYARYLCLCVCGQTTVVRGAQVKRGKTRSCGCLYLERTVAMGHANRKVVVTYRSIHKRIQVARGPAQNHRCVACGGLAQHWSLAHTAPVVGFSDRGRPFSDDIWSYDPRCVSCHKRYDLSRR